MSVRQISEIVTPFEALNAILPGSIYLLYMSTILQSRLMFEFSFFGVFAFLVLAFVLGQIIKMITYSTRIGKRSPDTDVLRDELPVWDRIEDNTIEKFNLPRSPISNVNFFNIYRVVKAELGDDYSQETRRLYMMSEFYQMTATTFILIFITHFLSVISFRNQSTIYVMLREIVFIPGPIIDFVIFPLLLILVGYSFKRWSLRYYNRYLINIVMEFYVRDEDIRQEIDPESKDSC
jgi:hypothetical protein